MPKITKSNEFTIGAYEPVTVTQMGHLVEVQHMQRKNTKAHIRKIDKDTYVELATGEIKEFKKSETRGDNFNSLRQTFKKMRYLINNNFTGAANELFLTLTYRGDLQTNDHKRVGDDYKKFMKRLKYEYGHIEAIRVLEPHASGNYHMHVLTRFEEHKSIFIPNNVDKATGKAINAPLYDIWGNGFVTIKGTSEIDNVGAYLTAYLTDIEITPENVLQVVKPGEVVEIKEVDGKKYVKGGRLKFYKPGVNIFTKTRGLKYPERQHMDYEDIKKIVGAATPNYRVSFDISDEDTQFHNTISYEQYNLKRPQMEQ